MQACNEGKRCYLNYKRQFLLAFLKDPIYVLHLNVTEILFKTQPVGGVDYGLLLWNRKQVVFINIYNHLGIGYEVVLIKLFYQYIFFHKLRIDQSCPMDIFLVHFLDISDQMEYRPRKQSCLFCARI